jgi:hypothetical protein
MPAKESARAERDSASRSSFAGKETGPMIRNASIRGNLLRVTDPRSGRYGSYPFIRGFK